MFGARGVLLGSIAGAIGGLLTRSEGSDPLRSAAASALLFGFILVPSVMSAIGAARAIRAEQRPWTAAALLLRGAGVAALAATAWGVVGTGVVYALGTLTSTVRFDFAALLRLSAVFGIGAGSLTGLATCALGLRRRSSSRVEEA
jgi:hypothetical protein